MRIHEATIKYRVIESGESRPILDKPELAAEYLKSAFTEYPQQETFWVIMLNRKNRPLGRHMVSLGTATSCLCHPREVLKPAILAGATAIIVGHNHPSGDPAPSAADVQMPRQLREACKAMDIDLLDHVICGEAAADPRGLGHYSFRASGML